MTNQEALASSIAQTAEKPAGTFQELYKLHLDKMYQRGMEIGRILGEVEGHFLGENNAYKYALLVLLEKRFGRIPVSLAERVADAELQKVKEAMFDIFTLPCLDALAL